MSKPVPPLSRYPLMIILTGKVCSKKGLCSFFVLSEPNSAILCGCNCDFAAPRKLGAKIAIFKSPLPYQQTVLHRTPFFLLVSRIHFLRYTTFSPAEFILLHYTPLISSSPCLDGTKTSLTKNCPITTQKVKCCLKNA